MNSARSATWPASESSGSGPMHRSLRPPGPPIKGWELGLRAVRRRSSDEAQLLAIMARLAESGVARGLLPGYRIPAARCSGVLAGTRYW